MDNADLDDLFEQHGERTGVPWQLIKAIYNLEKTHTPQIDKAINNEDTYGNTPIRHHFALGLLLESRDSIREGVDILRHNLELYGLLKGIAICYHLDELSAPPNGPFKSQNYIDAVISSFKQYGGDVGATVAKYENGEVVNCQTNHLLPSEI